VKFALLGGTGYIGGRLARYLKSKRHHIRVTTRRSLKQIPSWLSADQVVQDDLENVEAIRKHLADREVIIHLASPDERQAEQDPRAALRAGGETVWNVLEAIAGLPKKPRFIFLSTFHVYGQSGNGIIAEKTPPRPLHPYGVGRYMGETIAQLFRRRHGVKALCVRLSNVVGPPADFSVPRWGLLLGDLCLQAVTKKKLVLRSPPTTQRNFIPMEDCLRGLEFLARATAWPADGVIHLGSPKTLTLDHVAHGVAECAAKKMGVPPPIVYLSKVEDVSLRKPLKFSVRRLQRMGFVWTNSFDREVTNTLTMCQEAYKKWGRNIFNVCGLPTTAGRSADLQQRPRADA
jgi:UDP-glucose 4-epimerase